MTKFWPFKVIAGPGEKTMIIVRHMGGEKHLMAEEISSMVLTKMLESAEVYLDCAVRNAVITVPPTSMIHSARPPRMPVLLPASMLCKSSVNPLLQQLPTV